MFQLKDAILVCPFRLCDLYIAVFPRLILFGPLKNDEFSLKQTFCIDLGNFRSFYHAIVQILSTFELENLTECRNEEFCNFNTFKYLWEMRDTDSVKLKVIYGDEVIQSCLFTYLQFNELIYLFSQFLLLPLKMNMFDLEFLSRISNLNFVEIVQLNDPLKAEDYIKNMGTIYKDDYFRLKILLSYHQDLLLILNKMKNLCNISILPNRIDSIF